MKKSICILLVLLLLCACAPQATSSIEPSSVTSSGQLHGIMSVPLLSIPSHDFELSAPSVVSEETYSSTDHPAKYPLAFKRPASDYSAQIQIQLTKEQEGLLQAHTQYPVLSIKESVRIFSPNQNNNIISIIAYEETIADELAEDVFYYFLNDYDTLLHRALWATYEYYPFWLNEDLVLLDGVELYSVSQKRKTRIIIPDHVRKDNEYYHSIAVAGYTQAESLHIIYYFQYDYHNYLYAYDIENKEWTHLCDFPFAVMTTAPASTEMEWIDEMVIAFNDESGRQCLYDFETGRLQLP